jgi:DNA-binding transcriptional regulator YiaG
MQRDAQDRWARKRERQGERPVAAPGAGLRIRQMRQAAGMTQEDLAAALDVSFQALSSWETARFRPPADAEARVAAVTGWPVAA